MTKSPSDSDRRVGPSRLSLWTGKRIAALWIMWPGGILLLCAAAVLLSVRFNEGLGEVRSDLTRGNLIGLTLIVLVPPAYVSGLWWRMRQRRRSDRHTQ